MLRYDSIKSLFICTFSLTLLLSSIYAHSFLAESLAEQVKSADATATVELINSQARFTEGTIQTHFVFRKIEAIRGIFPAYFEVCAPGGIYNGRFNADSRLPALDIGNSYLINVEIQGKNLSFYNTTSGVSNLATVDLETLKAACADLPIGANLSDYKTLPILIRSVTESGLLEDDNVAYRYTSPDRNEPIPVYADISTRPPGISQKEALTALENALDAWENKSSLLFEIVGTEVFTQSAEEYSSNQEYAIRVQFHDNFNRISNSDSILAFGGSRVIVAAGYGGTVKGRSFNPITDGFVVIDHNKLFLQDASNLEQVLAHELGHVIGLAHSSETANESNSEKAESIMYYLAHPDRRGAILNSYDINTVRKAYPLNTPPYGFDRIMYAVTHYSNTTLTNQQVNQVTLVGYDLQGDALTLQIDSSSSILGKFSNSGSIISYAIDGYYNDSTVDNINSDYYDKLEARFSDGVHLSPFFSVRIVGVRGDSAPFAAPDGIPDSWMTTYFGSAGGSNASSDEDGDGFDNLSEYQLGTNPADANSQFKIIQYTNQSLKWTSQPFTLYQVEASTNLLNWQTIETLGQTNSKATLSTQLPVSQADESIFYRVKRVP
ncbi:MAG: matrixin family metalloprotease [Verrucomicrobiota bacterium]|nr:matrixin family metalloprotease [Verrucomicrobiota bacterium]